MMYWSDIGSAEANPVKDRVSVNVLNRDALLSDLEARLIAKRGFAVATLNLDHVVKIRDLPAFKAAYLNHSHVTADGAPIVWLSRLAGRHIDLVPGSELVDPVADMAASLDVPVGFVGSTEQSLAEAARILTSRYPNLKVVARIAPPMGFDPTGAAASAAIAELGEKGVRLVFLALGAPKQEMFAAFAQEKLPQTGFLSIGAGLDFISGVQIRAPKLARRLRVEWLWRLAMNPARLYRRYGACIAFLPRLVTTAMRSRNLRS